MKEPASPVAPLVAQSPVPGLVIMLQYLLHQHNVTDSHCNQYKKNISLLHEETLKLESENDRLQNLIMELQQKATVLEEQLHAQALEIEVKSFQKLETEQQQLNCSSIEKNLNAFKSFKEQQSTLSENDVNPAETLRRFFEVFLKKETPECNKDRALLLAVRSNDLAATTALVSAGTNVNTEDATSWHRTPLHWAAVQNLLNVAQILLKGGANIESRETGLYSLYTPLHEAAKHGHLTMCQMLLNVQAEPNSRDGSGSTPLHTAARQGHLSVVKLLVEYGATVTAKDNWDSTPRDRATRFSHTEVANWLIEAEISSAMSDK